MSTYAGNIIKSGTTLDLNQLISELTNELPTPWNETSTGSVSNTTGTAMTTHFTLSATVEIDEVLVFVSQTQVSGDTSGTRIVVNHRVNGTTPTPDIIVVQDATTSTSGNQGSATCITVHKDLSGAQNFDVRFARYGGAGTVYAGAARAHLLRFKRRA